MATRTSLKEPRLLAFINQNGFCYYCKQPMWKSHPYEITTRFNVSFKQAKCLQCTGEHLIAHKDGGGSGNSNIVAACRFCNCHRHRRKTEIDPVNFKRLVQRRLGKGKWHGLKLH